MKSIHEQVEMLRALVVLAVADGRITSSEMGLLKSLAGRAGVGQASLNALVDRAKNDPGFRNELFALGMSDPDSALELLVAAARIDGDIAPAERELLVATMDKLKLPTARFTEIYSRAIRVADELRKVRTSPPNA